MEVQAATVRSGFSLFLRDQSINAIAQVMNAMHAPTALGGKLPTGK